ncbi:MAG: helix-turn-helix transcriptional regulator [bacterium]
MRSLRKTQKFTQESLSEKVEITPKYLGQIERAEVNPTITILKKIAHALGITLSELFSFSNSDIFLTRKELLSSKIISFVNNLNEERIGFLEEIIENIFKWVKRMK